MLINGVELNIGPKANLQDADLRGTDLRGTDLRGTDLRKADLRDADLRKAYLRGANLQDADLRGTDLRKADLRDADLRDADLRGTDLRKADLRDADLRGTDLRKADLRDADLHDAKNVSPLPETIIAGEGDLIAYKKLHDGTICKLKIPVEAKRSNATGRKCRAEYAVVLEGEGVSIRDRNFKYTPGATVRPTAPFDENRWNECAPGIHFYITREEAENH